MCVSLGMQLDVWAQVDALHPNQPCATPTHLHLVAKSHPPTHLHLTAQSHSRTHLNLVAKCSSAAARRMSVAEAGAMQKL